MICRRGGRGTLGVGRSSSPYASRSPQAFFQSSREGRLRSALAAWSRGNDSLAGSHFSLRPSVIAMLPMCITVASRCRASAVLKVTIRQLLRDTSTITNDPDNRQGLLAGYSHGTSIRWYNEQRLHSALGFLRPIDYCRGIPEAMYAVRRQKLAEARHRRRDRNLPLRQPTLPFTTEEPVASPGPGSVPNPMKQFNFSFVVLRAATSSAASPRAATKSLVYANRR